MIRIHIISPLQIAAAAQAGEIRARVRVAFDDPKVDFRDLPLRDAQEQIRHGGLDSYVVVTDHLSGLVYVAGKDGGSRMKALEWDRYQNLVAWARQLQPRPSYTEQLQSVLDMFERFQGSMRRAYHSDFAQTFEEIEDLLRRHEKCLCEDEREDLLRAALARLQPLKEAVLRAEEIWREESPQPKPRRVRTWAFRGGISPGGASA